MFTSRDGHEMGLKRQRGPDPIPPFLGTVPSSSFAYGSAPSYGYMGNQPPFPVVRLRGLPFDCTELDILEFFQGLDIVDILFIHKNGQFTGEAFCLLAYPLQVDFAIQKNRQNMGRRYVEVFRSQKQEYYLAVANEFSDVQAGSPRRGSQKAKAVETKKEPVEHTGVLRMRGLPFSVVKEDVLEFFKDFNLSEDQVYIVVKADGRATGEGFVNLGSPENSKLAMARDKMMLGSRYVELFPSSPRVMDHAIAKGKQRQS